MDQFRSGTVEGTGAAINIQLGWKPDYVKVWNIDDSDSLWPTVEWTSDMAAASAFKTLKVVDSGSTGNASSNKITTLGISHYAGDETHAPGFTIGADTALNVSAETLCWIAMRNGPGGER